MKDPVSVADGKYVYFLDEDNLLNCLRHGEPWPAFRNNGSHLSGGQLALYHELVKLQEGHFPAEERERLPRAYYNAAVAAIEAISETRPGFGPGEESTIHLGCAIWKAIEPEAFTEKSAG